VTNHDPYYDHDPYDDDHDHHRTWAGEPRFILRWWWAPDAPHPVTYTYSSGRSSTEDEVARWCQHGPEVWEQVQRAPRTFWVITPQIAREEMALWGPYDDYDHAVMIAATLR
jgi:hypothetical protein